MTVSTEWDTKDQTAILISYISPWEWNEHYDSIRKMHTMMASVEHKVDLIYDFSKGNSLPSRALLHFMRGITQPRPKNTNRIIAVGAEGLMVSIARILRRIYPISTDDIREVKTVAEARILLDNENKEIVKQRSYVLDDSNQSSIHHP